MPFESAPPLFAFDLPAGVSDALVRLRPVVRFPCHGRGSRARFDSQLHEDMLQMRFHRGRREPAYDSDLGISFSLG